MPYECYSFLPVLDTMMPQHFEDFAKNAVLNFEETAENGLLRWLFVPKSAVEHPKLVGKSATKP